jgi:hypothetical protein
VDRLAAATYYVLYRLTERGYEASPTTSEQAELLAFSADGRRVVLLRVRSRAPGSGFAMTLHDRRPAGRNVAYVFVDFGSAGSEPVLFFLRAERVRRLIEQNPSWPADSAAFSALEDCRDAWHRLGLSGRSSVRSASAVSSSPAL